MAYIVKEEMGLEGLHRCLFISSTSVAGSKHCWTTVCGYLDPGLQQKCPKGGEGRAVSLESDSTRHCNWDHWHCQHWAHTGGGTGRLQWESSTLCQAIRTGTFGWHNNLNDIKLLSYIGWGPTSGKAFNPTFSYVGSSLCWSTRENDVLGAYCAGTTHVACDITFIWLVHICNLFIAASKQRWMPILSNPPLSLQADLALIREVAARVDEAVASFEVEHTEELVVPFGDN